jgi:N-acetylglucosamine-6-phosphate deacetylase
LAATLAGTLLRDGEAVEGFVTVAGATVVELREGDPPHGALRHDGLIAAGLCDLQVNGAAGAEVCADPAALDRIEAALLAAGVTAYLPTVVAQPWEHAREVIAALAARVADPDSPACGIHVEGPLLSARHAGAQRRECFAASAADAACWWEDPATALVTLAPELDGALDAVRTLSQRGVVVSLGHSGAGADLVASAVAAGARAVTHLFNAMAPLHHRTPGLAGAALADVRLSPLLVAEGEHVDQLVLSLVDRLARDRVVLVSDASPAAAAPAGDYSFAGAVVHSDGERALTDDGVLAGSTVLLDEAVRRYSAATGCPLADAWAAASERPSSLIGRAGGLVPGGRADIVLLDRAGAVERVMFGGRWVDAPHAAAQ